MSSLNNPNTEHGRGGLRFVTSCGSSSWSICVRRRVLLAIAVVCGLAAPLLAVAHTPAPAYADSGYTVMHRLYNPNSGEHFYTASTYERDAVVRAGWKYEGEGWTAPTEGDDVYRLYNPYAGDHHYTLSTGERDALVKAGWNYEGVGWKSYRDHKAGIPLLREYNPNATTGTHNYTTSKFEHDSLVKAGWRDEGIAWWGAPKQANNGGNSSGNNGGNSNSGGNSGGNHNSGSNSGNDGGNNNSGGTTNDGGNNGNHNSGNDGDANSGNDGGNNNSGGTTNDGGNNGNHNSGNDGDANSGNDGGNNNSGGNDGGNAGGNNPGTNTPAPKYNDYNISVIAGLRKGKVLVDGYIDVLVTTSNPDPASIALYFETSSFGYPVLGTPRYFDPMHGPETDYSAKQSSDNFYRTKQQINGKYGYVQRVYVSQNADNTVSLSIVERGDSEDNQWSARQLLAKYQVPVSEIKDVPLYDDYEVKVVNPGGFPIYAGQRFTVMIKTANPDPTTFKLIANGITSSSDDSQSPFSNKIWPDVKFHDLPVEWDQSDLWGGKEHPEWEGDSLNMGALATQRVDGKYVYLVNVALDTTAQTTLGVEEITNGRFAGTERTRKAAVVTPQDLTQAEDKWINNVINKYSKLGMTSMQKMAAISDGLYNEFKYLPVSKEERLLRLLTYDGFYFDTYRWDSYISPAILTEIANRIGGFTTVENMYGKYPYGSDEWWQLHSTVHLIDPSGEERYYSACPLTDTGVVDPIPTIDLSKI